MLTARELGYVEAGRAAGSGTLKLILLHILPNVTSPIIVSASFELTRMILQKAAISLLGLDVQPTATWGGMVNDVRGTCIFRWLRRYCRVRPSR